MKTLTLIRSGQVERLKAMARQTDIEMTDNILEKKKSEKKKKKRRTVKDLLIEQVVGGAGRGSDSESDDVGGRFLEDGGGAAALGLLAKDKEQQVLRRAFLDGAIEASTEFDNDQGELLRLRRECDEDDKVVDGARFSTSNESAQRVVYESFLEKERAKGDKSVIARAFRVDSSTFLTGESIENNEESDRKRKDADDMRFLEQYLLNGWWRSKPQGGARIPSYREIVGDERADAAPNPDGPDLSGDDAFVEKQDRFEESI